MDDATINLMARWRAGDQRAAEKLFRRYADRLIALARSRLSAKLSQRTTPKTSCSRPTGVSLAMPATAATIRNAAATSGDSW
jgi:ECF sigma factor